MPIVNGIRGGPKSLLSYFLGKLFCNFFDTFFSKKHETLLYGWFLKASGAMFLEVYLHAAAFGELNHSPRPRDLWFEILPHHQFSSTIMTLKSMFSRFFWNSHRYDGLEVDHCLCWSSRWLQIYIGGGGILDAFWTAQLKVFLVLFASTFCLSWNLNAGILFLAIFEKSFDLVRMYARVWVHPGAGCAPKAPFTQVYIYIYIYI